MWRAATPRWLQSITQKKYSHKNGIGYIEDVGAGHRGEINRLVKTEYGQSIGHALAFNLGIRVQHGPWVLVAPRLPEDYESEDEADKGMRLPGLIRTGTGQRLLMRAVTTGD